MLYCGNFKQSETSTVGLCLLLVQMQSNREAPKFALISCKDHDTLHSVEGQIQKILNLVFTMYQLENTEHIAINTQRGTTIVIAKSKGLCMISR